MAILGYYIQYSLMHAVDWFLSMKMMSRKILESQSLAQHQQCQIDDSIRQKKLFMYTRKVKLCLYCVMCIHLCCESENCHILEVSNARHL